MLVLARMTGQRIHIGDDIWIEVLDIRGHSVRLGVEAPRQVAVHREEIFRKIRQEQQSTEPSLNQTVPLECHA